MKTNYELRVKRLASRSASVAVTVVTRVPGAWWSSIVTRMFCVVNFGACRLRVTVMGMVAVLLRLGVPPSRASIRN